MRLPLVLLAAVGIGQTQDARPLLREVAEASRNLTSFRVEGRIAQDLDLSFMGGKYDLTFRVATRSPQMRIEIGGVLDPQSLTRARTNATVLCDGARGWFYLDSDKQYSKVDPGEVMQGPCAPGTLTSFEHVADDVISATITGSSHVRFEDRTVACTLVQARYRLIPDLMVPPYMTFKIGRVSRTMCIDPVRKLILSDRLEADLDARPVPDHITETVTYDRIERNPDLSAALFEFHPPEGKTLFVPPVVPKTQPRVGPPVPSPNVSSMPEPISVTEPEYSQEAWDEGIQGRVIVLADIEPDGTMSGARVQQSIGYGLDEKAIECVRRWRFHPAMDGLRPVKGVAYVALDFYLPANRPAQPSPGPVPRPLPAPRLPVVELKPPTDLDEFFYLVATNLEQAAPCGKIDPLAGGGGAGMERRGYQIQTLQSECYAVLATALHDPKLCEYVKPVKTDTFDGSKLDKAECVSGLGGANSSVVPHDMRTFVALMRRTGADDSQVAGCLHQLEPYNDPTYVAYRKLLEDRQFLDRLRGARSYAEPWAPSRARPALALEYLYQMVAVDTNDARLCARVSPNATFVQSKLPARLLRSQCYVSIAYNQRNDALCDQLPPSGASPYVVRKFDSRENCHQDVATYGRPDLREDKLTYGPALLPHAADFATALEQIGYSRSEAVTLVPKPTAADYWTCFPVQDRATFLKRVMRLK